MKRPLCIAAVSLFTVQIIALFMPQQALLPLAAVFSCAGAGVCLLCKKKKLYTLCIVLFACAAACVWRFGYDYAIVRPAQRLAGQTAVITATVENASFYSNSMMSAELKITGGEQLNVKGTRLSVSYIPQAEKGEQIELNVKFAPLSPSDMQYENSKGVFISAEYMGGFKLLNNKSPSYFFNKIQQALANSYKVLTDEKTGIIGSAMALGEKSGLTFEIKEGFRAAGLSHMLVVSGMHLAAFSGIVFTLLSYIIKNKRAKAIACIICTVLFVLLTGVTASAVRAGVMLCLIYLGTCFKRQADTITSLCAALLILTLQNPYIIADIGFLLSFAATAGIIAGNTLVTYLQAHKFLKNARLIKAVRILSVPLSASLATAPVLILFGMGISAFGLLFNLIAVPFLPIIAAFVFLASLINFIPFGFYIAKLFSLLAFVLIKLLLIITQLAQSLPFSVIYFKGAAAALILIITYFLIYFAAKNKIKFAALVIAAFFVLSVSLVAILESGVIRVKAMTDTQNAPVAVYKNGEAIIIFRAKPNINKYTAQFFKENNIKSVSHAIMLGNFDNYDGIQLLDAEAVIKPEDFEFNSQICANDDIIISMYKQKSSCAAVIDIKGFKIGLNKGTFDFEQLLYLDVFIAGQSKAQNLEALEIIANNTVPEWLIEQGFSAALTSNAEIAVRAGKSYKIFN